MFLCGCGCLLRATPLFFFPAVLPNRTFSLGPHNITLQTRPLVTQAGPGASSAPMLTTWSWTVVPSESFIDITPVAANLGSPGLGAPLISGPLFTALASNVVGRIPGLENRMGLPQTSLTVVLGLPEPPLATDTVVIACTPSSPAVVLDPARVALTGTEQVPVVVSAATPKVGVGMPGCCLLVLLLVLAAVGSLVSCVLSVCAM